MVSRELSREFKNKLTPTLLKKIEKELFFGNGMSIKLSMEHFEIFHNILKKFYIGELNQFEKDCLKKIIQTTKSNKKHEIKIIDQQLAEKIINFYGDPESRKIIQCMMGKNQTISEILKFSKVLKSPGYRKIENLLLEGLILESGKISTNNKRVSQYKSIFDELNATINQQGLFVEGVINSHNFNESSIVKMGLFDN